MLEKYLQLKPSLQVPVPRDLPTLRDIAEKAARACGAVKVVLFGSVARGAINSHDLDLLLVVPDGTDLFQAAFNAQEPFVLRLFAMDLIPMHVTTFQNSDSLLALEIANYGVVLYG